MPQALKSCPKCNKLSNLVTLSPTYQTYSPFPEIYFEINLIIGWWLSSANIIFYQSLSPIQTQWTAHLAKSCLHIRSKLMRFHRQMRLHCRLQQYYYTHRRRHLVHLKQFRYLLMNQIKINPFIYQTVKRLILSIW